MDVSAFLDMTDRDMNQGFLVVDKHSWATKVLFKPKKLATSWEKIVPRNTNYRKVFSLLKRFFIPHYLQLTKKTAPSQQAAPRSSSPRYPAPYKGGFSVPCH